MGSLDVKVAAMNFFRTDCSPIAWILLAVVLFNGIACSLGHVALMHGFAASLSAEIDHASQHTAHEMSDMPAAHAHMHHLKLSPLKQSPGAMDMSGGMKMESSDCAFAGTLTLAILFFVAMSWLIRAQRPRTPLPSAPSEKSPRHVISGLHPHAP